MSRFGGWRCDRCGARISLIGRQPEYAMDLCSDCADAAQAWASTKIVRKDRCEDHGVVAQSYRRSFRCPRCGFFWEVAHGGDTKAWSEAEVCPQCQGHGVTLSTEYIGAAKVDTSVMEEFFEDPGHAAVSGTDQVDVNQPIDLIDVLKAGTNEGDAGQAPMTAGEAAAIMGAIRKPVARRPANYLRKDHDD